jgi:hypothetical protein
MKKSKKGGFIVTAELVMISTILVIGMIVGLVVVRDAVVAEMEDVAESIGDMNQSFQYKGIVADLNAGEPATAAAAWSDAEDDEAGDELTVGANTESLDYTVVVATPNEETDNTIIP